ETLRHQAVPQLVQHDAGKQADDDERAEQRAARAVLLPELARKRDDQQREREVDANIDARNAAEPEGPTHPPSIGLGASPRPKRSRSWRSIRFRVTATFRGRMNLFRNETTRS